MTEEELPAWAKAPPPEEELPAWAKAPPSEEELPAWAKSKLRPPSRPWGETAADIGSGLVSGAVSGTAKAAGGALSLANTLLGGVPEQLWKPVQAGIQTWMGDSVRPEDIPSWSQGTEQTAQSLGEALSTEGLKQRQAEQAGNAWAFLKDPALAAQTVGGFAPYLAAGLAAGGAAPALAVNTGLIAGGTTQNVQQQIQNLPANELAASLPDYEPLRAQVGDQEARAQLAQSQGLKAGLVSGALGGLLGPMAGSTVGRAASRLIPGVGAIPTIARGAVTEGAAMGPLMGGSQVGENVGLNRPWMENVPEQTAVGAVLGSLMGGARGTVRAFRPPAPAERPPSEILPESAPPEGLNEPPVAPIPAPSPAPVAPIPAPVAPAPIAQNPLRGPFPSERPSAAPGPLPRMTAIPAPTAPQPFAQNPMRGPFPSARPSAAPGPLPPATLPSRLERSNVPQETSTGNRPTVQAPEGEAPPAGSERPGVAGGVPRSPEAGPREIPGAREEGTPSELAPATPAPADIAPARPPASENLRDPRSQGQAQTEALLNQKPPPPATLGGLTTQEVPIAQLRLSDDVPQFKSGANPETGVVEPLGGKYDRTGAAPIVVWERANGDLEVISGRHRLDLARRSGEPTIPAQVLREADGFNARMAANLDAELNIRDGQGQVKDYVQYFQGSGLRPEEAESRGLLARAAGQRGYGIATRGGEALIAAHRGDVLSDEAAYRIATTAPGDSRLQAVGIKAVQDGKTLATATNLMQAVKTMVAERGMAETTGDMFGFDDSAIREAGAMAQIASRHQRQLSERLAAIQGAAKRPELARKEGVDVADPEALRAKITEIRRERDAWDSWSTNPDLVARIRAEAQVPASQKTKASPPTPTPAETPPLVEPPPRLGGERGAREAEAGPSLLPPGETPNASSIRQDQGPISPERPEGQPGLQPGSVESGGHLRQSGPDRQGAQPARQGAPGEVAPTDLKESWPRPFSDYENGASLPADLYHGLPTKGYEGGQVDVQKNADGTYNVAIKNSFGRLIPYATRADAVIAHTAAWRAYGGNPLNDGAFIVGKVIDNHRASIRQALASGQPIAPEVLKDYPDLITSHPPKEPVAPEAESSPLLTDYSKADLQAEQARLARVQAQEEAANQAAARKAEADRARNDFVLSGSDRPADLAMARGQDALFSRGTGTSPAPAETARVLAEHPDVRRLGDRIRVVERQAELRPELQPMDGGPVKAVIDRGRVVLVGEHWTAEDLANMDGVLRHEAGVHLARDSGFYDPQVQVAGKVLRVVGLKALVGEASWNDVTQQLETLRRNENATVVKAFELAKQAKTSPELMPEEALGYLAELNPQHSIVRRLLATVRAALYRMGVKVKLGDAELVALARAGLRQASKFNVDTGESARFSKRQDDESGIRNLENDLKERYALEKLNLSEDSYGNINLNLMVVRDRRQGTGTSVMNELIEYADKKGKTIKLSTATNKDQFGTTSKSRLVSFYKRFGFVENKGKNKDYSIQGEMYRLPIAIRSDARYSRPRAWADSLPPEVGSMADKIGAEPKPWTERLAETRDTQPTRLRQGMVDRFARLLDNDRARFGRDVIDTHTALSGWVAAKMGRSPDGALEVAFLHGRLKWEDGALNVQETKQGLAKALAPVASAGELNRFWQWIIAHRSQRLMSEGRERLFTPEEIAAGVKLNEGTMAGGAARNAVYRQAFDRYVQLQKSVLDVPEQAGLFNAEQRAQWEHDFYLPYFRVIESEGEVRGPSTGGGKLVRQKAFEQLKGGTEKLGDPLQNILRNWHHLIDASLKNRAATLALETAEHLGVAKKVPEALTDKTSVWVMKDGNKTHYNVSDPLTLEAISALNAPLMSGTAIRAFAATKRALTIGVTIAPAFKVANLLKDSIAALAVSKLDANLFKLKPLINPLRGAWIAGEGSPIQAALLAGGGTFRMGSQLEGSADAAARRIAGWKPDTVLTSADQFRGLFDTLKSGLDAWNRFGDRLETANRAALYEQLRKEGKTHLQAALAARDVMDFTQSGAWPATRFLITIVPFLNPRIQGLDVLYRKGVQPLARAVTGRASVGEKQQALRFATVTTTVALASTLLYLHYRDDPDFQEREQWDRDSYWWFKIGGKVYRIPKPFEIGALGTLAERLVEQIVDQAADGKLFAERLKHMLLQTFAFDPTPQLIKPALEVYANRSAFTGRPIETLDMERLSPALRRRYSTSALAIGASQAGLGKTGLSPVQIEHLMRGYLGWIGAQALLIGDYAARPVMGLPERPMKQSDVPFIGDLLQRFAPDGRGSRYVTEFYDQLKQVRQIAADARLFQKLGDSEALRDLIAQHGKELGQAAPMEQGAKAFAELGQEERRIGADRRLSGVEKQSLIDRLAQQKAARARHVMSALRPDRGGARP